MPGLSVNRSIQSRHIKAHAMSFTPASFVNEAFLMPYKGELKKFSFKDRRYLMKIYNTSSQKVLLCCGRQVEKCHVISKTHVLTSKGSFKRIDELVLGDQVVSLDTGTNKFVTSDVVWISNVVNKESVKITTRRGHNIYAAKSHPIRTWGSWTNAGDIAVGDRILGTRRAGEFTGTCTRPQEEVKLVAYLLGDGSTSDSSISFSQDSSNTPVLDDFYRCLRGLGIEQTRNNTVDGSVDVGLSNKRGSELRRIITESGLAGKTSYTKSIPDWVFDLSEGDTALFVNRLWATDGHVKRNTRSRYSIEYCSMSPDLIFQLQALLWKFGIPSKIRKNWPNYWKNQGIERHAYTLRIETQEGVRKFLTNIGALGKSESTPLPDVKSNNNGDTYPMDIQCLISDIVASRQSITGKVRPANGEPSLTKRGLRRTLKHPPSKNKISSYVEFFRSLGDEVDQRLVDELDSHLHSDFTWDEVVAVEDIGVQECLDIEVRDTHNFVANGIVTHNSTSLGNISLTYSMLRRFFRTLFVSPTQQQTEVFSRDRIETPLRTSPILKTYTSGAHVKDNVLFKRFINDSTLTLRYAFLSADRTRGISADMLMLDEIQDINLDVIPVIEETLFTSDYKIQRYSGTPKSLDNTIADYWTNQSTQNEWLVPCDSCGSKTTGRYWNVLGVDNITRDGLICSNCGAKIYATHPDAQWASMNPDPGPAIPFEGFRVPQLIHPKIDWVRTVDKLENYPRAKFFNEVLGLGYDLSDRPLTKGMIKKNCTKDPARSMSKLEAFKNRGSSNKIFMGIDWGGGSLDNSFTVMVLGTYVGGKFYIFYAKRFQGADASSNEELLNNISRYIEVFKPYFIGVDFGGGFDKNEKLISRFGIRRVVQFQYAPSSDLMRYDKKYARFMVNRTAALSAMINAIDKGGVFEFPPWEEWEHPFADDMVSIMTEYNKSRDKITFARSPSSADDTLHALTYCFLASTNVHPRNDILAPTGMDSPSAY